jgi:imidazolonepropionase-like amidohydrolase
MEVLQIATRNGTRHSGLDKDLGSIETGTLTDLVVPSRNLDGISHTRSITHVVQNGVVYDGDDLSRIHPDPARAKRMSFQPSTPP